MKIDSVGEVGYSVSILSGEKAPVLSHLQMGPRACWWEEGREMWKRYEYWSPEVSVVSFLYWAPEYGGARESYWELDGFLGTKGRPI